MFLGRNCSLIWWHLAHIKTATGIKASLSVPTKNLDTERNKIPSVKLH